MVRLAAYRWAVPRMSAPDGGVSASISRSCVPVRTPTGRMV